MYKLCIYIYKYYINIYIYNYIYHILYIISIYISIHICINVYIHTASFDQSLRYGKLVIYQVFVKLLSI